jgi:hypothetical protein
MAKSTNRQDLKAARQKLEQVSRKSREETPEYLAANAEVARLEDSRPWRKR